MIEPNMTVQRSMLLAGGIHDEQAKAIYEVLSPLFGLGTADEIYDPARMWGKRFMQQGATVEIDDERRGEAPVIMVTIPVSVALVGEDAKRFLAAIEEAQG